MSMFVNRSSTTFEADCKSAALNIAKALIDSEPSITSVLLRCKSLQCDDCKQVSLGGAEVVAYSAGRKSREEILSSLSIETVPISRKTALSDLNPAARSV